MDMQPKMQPKMLFFCWICLQVVFSSVLSDEWKAEIVSPIEALVSSCVVLPCKFNYPNSPLPESRLKGIWHRKNYKHKRIYDEDSTLIEDSFKGRTRLIGKLGEKNCTLEINDVKDHDNGPFCFRAEIPNNDKFSFECASIHMKTEPDKPTLDHEENFVEDSMAIFKCYVRHTCPTHHPIIEWSRLNDKSRLSYKDNGHGVWEVESLLFFSVTEEDDHTDITCSVTFHGNRKSEVTHKLYIKRKENYLHIIIPLAAVFGTIVLFGVACFFVTKRYKKQIQDLQRIELSLQNVPQMEGRLNNDCWKHQVTYKHHFTQQSNEQRYYTDEK